MKFKMIISLLLLPLCLVQCDNDTTTDYGLVDTNTNTNTDSDSETSNFNLIDSKASTNTQTLANNLYKSMQEGTMVGQQQAYIEDRDESVRTFTKECDIFNISGKYPLVSGEDFGTLTNDSYTETNWYGKQSTAQVDWVKECYKEGVYTTFSWHFREPYNGKSFYSSDLSSTVLNEAFRSILEGGENHDYYKAKLDMIAEFCNSLVAEDGELIPIIFRPWHEMNASWFWWGVPDYASAKEFIQNWQFTVEYLRDTCNVHNIIYAYSPSRRFVTEADFLESYPGDDYVDMVGFDSYEDYSTGTTAIELTISQLEILHELATEKGKLAALTECGYDLDSKTELDDMYNSCYQYIIEQSGADIAYMLFWYNSDDKHFIPAESSSSAMISSFSTFLDNESIFMMDDITSPFAAE